MIGNASRYRMSSITRTKKKIIVKEKLKFEKLLSHFLNK